MTVVVTGGAGFIGSHIVVELLEKNHQVIVLDDFSNARPQVIADLKQVSQTDFVFREVDISDYQALVKALDGQSVTGIIHLAGYKSIAESFDKPLEYYQNNLDCTMNLLRYMVEYSVSDFVFSSSATVYGDGQAPFHETDELQETTNPYGETKRMGERIITDFSRAYPDKRMTLLRYFNPVGAHPSGLIGESHLGQPTNLMPIILQVAAGERDHVQVFGNDFPTSDGSGVRDYIHVVDLAKAHLAALEQSPNALNVYNVGTGQGVSVLELIEAFETVNQVPVKRIIGPRRPGDIATSFADVSKIKQELGWQAQRTVTDMVRDAWNYRLNQGGIK